MGAPHVNTAAPVTALKPIEDLIPGFYVLRDYMRFYPVSGKRQLVRDRDASIQEKTIREWSHNPRRSGFGGIINHQIGSLIVFDCEGPGKLPDWRGADGELRFYGLLEEHNIRVAGICPATRTPTGGIHFFYRCPKGIRVKGGLRLWDGIDVLTAGDRVVLAGTRTDRGTYDLIGSYENVPECPAGLIQVIKDRQKQIGHVGTWKPEKQSIPVPVGSSTVSRRQWFLLFRNTVFRRFWHMEEKSGDTSLSAYEFHIAKACFCTGLTKQQTVHVVQHWWEERALVNRSVTKLDRVIGDN